ncbi:MAG TPA: carboxypeptidase regulatory-like domain-containing protein, partial [Terriglobales bacterium]|nr:carboxypeptidase regulatory-like domain-containing protein [Terriglobales bacterium]
MRVLFRLGVIAALCCWLLSAAVAQEITGSIAGTVHDPQGAVVPGATVTVTDTDKGIVIRTLKTSSGGDFAVPFLPVGHYSLSVQAPGFQKYLQSGIALNANDKLTFSPTLAVGSTEQTVEVQANTTQIELQSAQAAGLINGTQIRELSLNNRNYEQLVLLQPGVSSTNNTDQIYVGAFTPFGTNSPNMSLNGGRLEQNNWLVDGFDNVDRGSNTTLLTFPSVDAISEFRVIRGQYEPELGRSAGGQVNVVTRTGTSALHGGAYEFFRNDFLNGNDWFNKRNQVTKGLPNKPLPLRYNNFGGTIGGPVWIPKIYEQKNKTFFFVSEEWRRTLTYTNPQAEVPTAAMLQGNFAHPVCTSWTGTTCNSTGTSINPANFSPVAAAYIKDIYSKIPAPNSLTDPFGLLPTLRNVYNFREDIYKIDHVFSQKLTVSGKYLHDDIPTVDPQGFFGAGTPIPNVSTTHSNAPGSNYTVRATVTLTPTFLIETGYGYSYGAIVSNPVGYVTLANSPNVANVLGPKLPFKTTLNRIPSLSFQSTALSPIGTFGPYRDYNRNHTAFGNVTKVMGTHTVKFGAIYYHYQKNENSGNGNQGSFSFNNAGRPSTATPTAEAVWGNFLLGHAQTFNQPSIDAAPDIRDNQFEYYVQD